MTSPIEPAPAADPRTPSTPDSTGPAANGAAGPALVPTPRTPGEPAAGVAGTAVSSNPQWNLTAGEVCGSFVAFTAWIVLIAAGVAIDTPKYVDKLEHPGVAGVWMTLGSGLVVLTCHVVPNVALLSCLASYLGVIGSRTIPRGGRSDDPPVDHKATYATAVTRGFYVYLIVLSGSVIFSSEGFGQWATTPTPKSASAGASATPSGTSYETYTRLAGMASLVSFTAGFNPELFRQLLSRFGGGSAKPADDKTKVPTPPVPASGTD